MLLVSPMEFPVFLLEIPKQKGRPPEGIIEAQLRNLYPGDPRDTEFDYYIRPVRRSKPPLRHVIVFVTSRAVRAVRVKQGKGLFPGIAFMSLAVRLAERKKDAPKTRLALLLTADWAEAARFEGDEVAGYFSAPWPSGGGALTGLVQALFTEREIEEGGFSVTAILREVPENVLRSLIPDPENRDIRVNTVEFDSLVPGLRGGRYAIFGRKKRKNPGRTLLVCLVAGLVLSLFPLRSLSLRYEGRLSRLKAACTEAEDAREAAGQYERRIAEILGQARRNPGDFNGDFYRIIRALESCLGGAWVRSLSLGESGFNLDAEGADSLEVVHALEASPCFTGIVLRQAAPSKIRGEQFVVSGGIVHGD